MSNENTDRVELNVKDKKLRLLAAAISLVVSVLITFIKFYAFNLTDSQGVYSDAVESIVNIFTAAMAIFVVYYASKPVDDDHPYGHGKVEYFSAAFEGGLISAAALLIFYQAGMAYYNGLQLDDLGTGTWFVALAAALNAILGVFLLFMGNTYNSTALKGSGHHVLSDVWTSVAIIAGLILIQITGIQLIDIVFAFGAGIYLCFTGYKILRSSIAGLLDEEDIGTLKELSDSFEKAISPGIIQIHHVKVIRSGWFHHIDAHVVVPEFWTVTEAHDNLNKFEADVINDYKYKGEMNFHTDPCEQKYCEVCDYKDCPVRQKAFVERRPVLLKDMRSSTEPDVFNKN